MALRSVRKQLTCPVCGDVLADAEYRPWPPRLRVSDLSGAPMPPLGSAIVLRSVEADLAAHPERRPRLEAQREFLRGQIGELVFDARCRRGHRTAQTLPGLVRAIRHTPGRWVPIR